MSLTAAQVHEAVAVLRAMGYHVVKFVPPSMDEGTWYMGRKINIGDEYTIPGVGRKSEALVVGNHPKREQGNVAMDADDPRWDLS